jgi:hypothetical protein
MTTHELSQRRACGLIGITRRGLKRAPREDRNRGFIRTAASSSRAPKLLNVREHREMIAHSESPKILTIIPLGYRARCTEAGCRNLGRVILRHFDAGGRPMDNAEFCDAHAKVRIERDRSAGLRVYDDR